MTWPVRAFVRRALLDNAALKLVALLLSLTLFIVVRGDRDTSISFYLPVAYTETEGRVMTSRPVDSVRVTVAGPWTRVRKFDERQVEPLHVDLSKLPDGDYVFANDLIQLPPGLRVTSINPPSIRLQFEERASKVVAIKPTFDGLPARGYTLGEVSVTPSHVTVRGPKSVVDAMSEVQTRPINIDGLTTGGEERVALEPTEPHVTVVERQTIDVQFRIVEELGMLALGPLRVEVHPAPGITLAVPASATTQPAKVKLLLRGAKNILDRIDPNEVATYVTWHAEDSRVNAPRPARVVVEGVPPGVAIEVDPRDVTLVPRP
jgi:YbbR domain-containing protein